VIRSQDLFRRLALLVSLFAVAAGSTFAQISGPLVVLIGAPGAGKSTQAGILAKEQGMTVISAADLIERNKQAFARYKQPNIKGVEPRVDSALNNLVEEALTTTASAKGVVLDGYPAAENHGTFFFTLANKLKLPPPLVIHLQITDEIAKKRMKGKDIEQDLKDYHRELDFARAYFTQVTIHDIDGTKKPGAVAKEIRGLVKAGR